MILYEDIDLTNVPIEATWDKRFKGMSEEDFSAYDSAEIKLSVVPKIAWLLWGRF